jgi:two-component system LytT family response regulator
MIRAIIIDDEQHCIEAIQDLIVPYHYTIKVLGAYNTVDDGVKATEALRPDLVFLDVEIKDKTGFDYLEQLQHVNFHVVFTTAYDKYAVKAFKFSALHYLLKPIAPEDFNDVIVRVKAETIENKLSEKIDTLLYNQKVKDQERRITINGTNTNTVLHVSNIIYCMADANCTFFYMKEGDKVFSSKTLKTYEKLFEDSDFCRVHQSYLVNLKHVKKFTKGKPTYVLMSNNDKIKVSINKKAALLQRLNNLG